MSQALFITGTGAGVGKSTAAQAMLQALADGGYDLKSLFKSAWSITLILPIIYIPYTMTIFPCF